MGVQFNLVRLTENHQIKPFECGDADLNDFLVNCSKDFSKGLLAVTYLIEDEYNTIAFFSLANDKISVTELGSEIKWAERFKEILPVGKQFNSYPAIKIVRLAVSVDYQFKGWGDAILDYLKIWFTTDNRTGCKYITVDAYRASLKFYEKNKMIYLTSKDRKSDTRLMYFDLSKLY